MQKNKMRNSSLLLLFGLCIVTFQQTHALRRIKRGSTATQNETKLSNDILLDLHNISNDIKLNEHAENKADGEEAHKEHEKSTWANKAVTAVEHVIDKAFPSLIHKSDDEKLRSDASPLHYNTNNAPLKSADNNAVASDKDIYKTSLADMLENQFDAERLFSNNMQHDVEFGAGDTPEVLIIDNGMRPTWDTQHGLNSFTLQQPNFRSIANSFKRLAELNKETKLNNLNDMRFNTAHINNNNHNLSGKQNDDNVISVENGNKEDTIPNHNKRNGNHNNGSNSPTVGSNNRNNDHITTSKENNSKTKYNTNNNNNDAHIEEEKSKHNSCMQQQQQLHEQQSELEESFPALLSLAHRAKPRIGEPSNLQAHSQAQQQLRMKHDKVDKAEEHKQTSPYTQTQTDTRQQHSQYVKHTNGKMLPMESFLKFANMMLYKVGPDGTPIHAQGAQLAMNGSPTASIISITPSKDSAENAETIDYIYNSLDPQLSLLRNAAKPPQPLMPSLMGTGNTALMSRPFFLPPYSLAGAAQPFNLIDNALDMLLGAEDNENNEMEIFCPIHHPKKKSSESAADSKDKDGVIQVCSCRIFKKNKNA
ncbi:putative uncharacterized protein DDB_G0285119 [Eurosta solidaginis]|uniref:putative uncharacterized protein DDB_G0285119 n=1 Tax=Eurosta solidaginis TaxID=178769 RepID=UPI00353158BA